MAEYCIDCWNRLNGTHYTEKDVKTDMDLCEGCGKWKPVVVVIHRKGIRGWLERRYHDLEYYVQCLRGR